MSTLMDPSEVDRSGLSTLFEAQRKHFSSDVTKSLEWRLDQLDRLERLVTENQKILETALKADFKTAIFDVAFEMGVLLGIIAEAKANVANWMTPTEVEVPPGLASTGHQARIFHDPYGVALIIVPFNAPVALLIAPLVAALSAGNTAIVKPSPVTAHVVDTLETLFARYFAPEDVTMVRGNRHVVSALLELPFDFIFSHQ